MNYKRTWESGRNAVGFAAACARLAFRFYVGDERSTVVAAIEVAERYASGEQIDRIDITDAANAAYTAADAANRVAYDAADAAAAYAAARVATIAARASAAAHATAIARAGAVADVAANAARTGVDDSEIRIAYARWVTKDLSCNRKSPEELRQAAGAAIVAGDEDLARELLQ